MKITHSKLLQCFCLAFSLVNCHFWLVIAMLFNHAPFVMFWVVALIVFYAGLFYCVGIGDSNE